MICLIKNLVLLYRSAQPIKKMNRSIHLTGIRNERQNYREKQKRRRWSINETPSAWNQKKYAPAVFSTWSWCWSPPCWCSPTSGPETSWRRANGGFYSKSTVEFTSGGSSWEELLGVLQEEGWRDGILFREGLEMEADTRGVFFKGISNGCPCGPAGT